ncbi:MAG: TetR/AcrR family transcriptional regulator [Solirubrobacterales bacterium]|nr:TetR/AcrR family transcriptional regulator [Solirubrobacterales bacterium]
MFDQPAQNSTSARILAAMNTATAPSPAPFLSIDQVRQRTGGRSARTRGAVLDAARTELLESGYAALSHRVVARRAGVDPATVYRRWPTRQRLATDALLEIARDAMQVPDTGHLNSDLEVFLREIAGALGNPKLLPLFHALSAANAETDDELLQTLRAFWEHRFTGAEALITRAIDRGDLDEGVDAHATIEQLVAPVYFRALVTGERIDEAFLHGCVKRALLGAAAI